ncbi:hypothetical protein [Streptomyces narbonensis]|uniref:hypothetical protein n=1 Tax=Streptomyces narbonensis TaxID=67333 RepID=UPI001673A414|nr:hypothetical protein [Streptomyces narbonensis]GGV94447.1 hypothetical protein GCM10010230_07640 [Streptomyces narbonensis]
MSQEAAPERAVPEQSAPPSVPEQKDAGAPKGLLQQMEELMAALSADLSQLDADIQSTAERLDPEPPHPDSDRLSAERDQAEQDGSEQDHSDQDGSGALRTDRHGPESTRPENHGSQPHDTKHRESADHGPEHRPAPGDPRPRF